MPNKKLSAVTSQTTAPADADRYYLVDMNGDGGNPLSTYIEHADLAVALGASLGKEVLEPSGGDDTSAVQAAIDTVNAAGGGYVQFTPGDYTVNPINVKSNVYVLLDPGVTVYAAHTSTYGSTYGSSDRIFNFLNGVSDAGIIGYGATITMNSLYTASQHQHGVYLEAVNRIVLKGFTVSNCAADGVMMTGVDPTDVLVQDIWSYQNGRGGIVLVGGDRITVRNCVFERTGRGTHGYSQPQAAGIHIEPEAGAGRLVQSILFDDCESIDNVGQGFNANFNNLDADSDVQFTLRGCRMRHNHNQGIQLNNHLDTHTGKFNIVIDTCEILDSSGANMYFYEWAAALSHVLVKNCRFEHPNVFGTGGWQYRGHITIGRTDAGNTFDIGGIHIKDCVFLDERLLTDTWAHNYSAGSTTQPSPGDTVTDQTSGATGTLQDISVTVGTSFAGNDAAGAFYVRWNAGSGAFGVGNTIAFSSGGTATVGAVLTGNYPAFYAVTTNDDVDAADIVDVVVEGGQYYWAEPTYQYCTRILSHTQENSVIAKNIEFTGTPDSQLFCSPGSTYVQTDGAAGKVNWFKIEGDNDEGWESLDRRNNSINVAATNSDDRSAIQAAVDAVYTVGGGQVTLIKGPYDFLLSGKISMKPNVILNLEPGVTIKPNASFPADDAYMFHFYNAAIAVENSGIRGFGATIDMDGESGYPVVFGTNTYNNFLEGVTIQNSGGYGMLIIGVDTPEKIVLRDVTIKDNQEAGIYLVNCDNLLIDDCRITGNGNNPDLTGGSYPDGIRVLPSSDYLLRDVTIRDTLISNNRAHGIRWTITNQVEKETSLKIRGCTFDSNDANAIVLQNCTDSYVAGGYVTIDDCHFKECGYGSVQLYDWCVTGPKVVIRHCTSRNVNNLYSADLFNRAHFSLYRPNATNNYDMGNLLVDNCHCYDDREATTTGAFLYTTGDNGGAGTTPARGDTVTDATSGATGTIVSISLTGGAWADGDAAGLIYIRHQSGTFATGNVINFSGGESGVVGGTVYVSRFGTRVLHADDDGPSTGEFVNVHLAGGTINWAQAAYNACSTFIYNMVNSKMTCDITYSDVTPENLVAASPGSFYRSTAGGASTTLFLKEANDTNTGWAGV